jgi:hypothetical protein
VSRYLASLSAGQMLTEHQALTSPAAEAVRRDRTSLGALAAAMDAAHMARVARYIWNARRTLVVGPGSFAAPGLQVPLALGPCGRAEQPETRWRGGRGPHQRG